MRGRYPLRTLQRGRFRTCIRPNWTTAARKSQRTVDGKLYRPISCMQISAAVFLPAYLRSTPSKFIVRCHSFIRQLLKCLGTYRSAPGLLSCISWGMETSQAVNIQRSWEEPWWKFRVNWRNISQLDTGSLSEFDCFLVVSSPSQPRFDWVKKKLFWSAVEK